MQIQEWGTPIQDQDPESCCDCVYSVTKRISFHEWARYFRGSSFLELLTFLEALFFSTYCATTKQYTNSRYKNLTAHMKTNRVSNKMTVSSQATLEIVVQPPQIVGVSQWLVPPVVARTRNRQLIEDYASGDKQIFATAVLYSSNMEDYSSALGGNWNVSAQLITEGSTSSRSGGSSSRSGSQQWLYFIFNPVSVSMEGMFAFNVVVSALSLSSPSAAGASQVVAGRSTRHFTVVAQPPRPERPGMS